MEAIAKDSAFTNVTGEGSAACLTAMNGNGGSWTAGSPHPIPNF